MPGPVNHYDVLGVAESADVATIKAATKRMRRRYHPDVNKSAAASEAILAINLAWEVLGTPATRLRHDAELRARRLARMTAEHARARVDQLLAEQAVASEAAAARHRTTSSWRRLAMAVGRGGAAAAEPAGYARPAGEAYVSAAPAPPRRRPVDPPATRRERTIPGPALAAAAMVLCVGGAAFVLLNNAPDVAVPPPTVGAGLSRAPVDRRPIVAESPPHALRLPEPPPSLAEQREPPSMPITPRIETADVAVATRPAIIVPVGRAEPRPLSPVAPAAPPPAASPRPAQAWLDGVLGRTGPTAPATGQD